MVQSSKECTEGFSSIAPGMKKDITSQSIPYRDPGKKFFTRGDVLVVNDNLAHYRGELEIVLTEIPNDGERNLVATYQTRRINVIRFCSSRHRFKLLK